MLTCAKDMSSIETDDSYEWFKDGSNTKISGQSLHEYNIGKTRSAAGSYTCQVVSQNSGTSELSDPVEIKFYCE